MIQTELSTVYLWSCVLEELCSLIHTGELCYCVVVWIWYRCVRVHWELVHIHTPHTSHGRGCAIAQGDRAGRWDVWGGGLNLMSSTNSTKTNPTQPKS